MPTLEWIGKDKVVNHHQEVPYRVLERQYSYDGAGQHAEDNGSENMIIHGDNLEALKALLPQYEGKVKCIYIDPPYNTGNEGWVYNDNVNDPKIKKWLGEVVGKEGEDLSRHDKWLCMMYPRLKLLQRLLADDGVIFISIDDTEYANLNLICDEIFGSSCFSLRDKDAHVDFTTVNAEMARVDVDDSKDSTTKAWRLSGGDSAFFREWFNTQPSEKRLSLCKGIIKQKLSKMNCVNDRELDEYIDRVIGTMSEDQLSELEQSPYPYVVKIQGKVKELIAEHRSGVFDTWLEQDKISCLPNYALPAVISPTAFTSMVPKSLYTAEEDMNEYEFKVVWALSELGNVRWWHRNISRLGFQINGPVHAYPDIIVMLHSGKILMVETKGDHLDNDESKEKAKIGDQWAKLAGKQYKYYMVFESKQPDYPGAYSLERFMEIVKGL